MAKKEKIDFRFRNMLKLGAELGIDPHRMRVALLQAAQILEELEPIDDLTEEEIAAVRAWIAARKQAIHDVG